MDEIVEKIGNFGLSQAFVFFVTSGSLCTTGMGMMFLVYGIYNPGWHCDNQTWIVDMETNGFHNLTYADNTTINIKSESDCDAWRACSNVVFDTSSSTIVTEWNLMCDDSWIPSTFFLIQSAGVFLGSYLCGPVGDRFGRKTSVVAGLFIQVVTNVMSGFSNSWKMFAALRFFLGVGLGGTIISAYLYPMEFVGEWWRAVLGSVPLWSIGIIQFAFVVYVFKDWRNIHFATAVLCAAFLIAMIWLPESIRWLAVKGKTNKCVNVIQKMASVNKKEPVNPDLISRKIQEIAATGKDSKKTGYMDIFKTVKLRKYSLKFATIWFIMSLVYYTISFGIKSFPGDFYMNLILFALLEVPAMLLIGPIANTFGRRWSSGIFLTASSLTSGGIVLTHFIPVSGADTIALWLAILSKMLLTAAWGAVTLTSTELYPTSVRNLHAGFLSAVARIGGIVAPFMIPADNSMIYIAYAINAALLLFSAVLIATVSESKGRAMTDTVMESTRSPEEASVFLQVLPPDYDDHEDTQHAI